MRKILIAGGLTAAAVAAVIGAASTNSITGVSTQTMGYTSADIDSPAAVSNVAYNVSATVDDSLTSVAITFATALPVGNKIQVGFGSNAFVPCADATNTNGTTGAVTTSVTTFTCALTGQTATGATKFRLLVTG
jgi:hypothetical protein